MFNQSQLASNFSVPCCFDTLGQQQQIRWSFHENVAICYDSQWVSALQYQGFHSSGAFCFLLGHFLCFFFCSTCMCCDPRVSHFSHALVVQFKGQRSGERIYSQSSNVHLVLLLSVAPCLVSTVSPCLSTFCYNINGPWSRQVVWELKS